MDPELAQFVSARTPEIDDTLTWRNGTIRIRLNGFLGNVSPPDRFVLAGRAIVVRGTEVLVVTTGAGDHIIPGGRREPGESTDAAIRREVLEETGWVVGGLEPLAVLHLHYETEKPTNVGHLIYPDFLWHVFTAVPVEYRERDRLLDSSEVVLGAEFRPIRDVLDRKLDSFQRQLLGVVAMCSGLSRRE